jgi:hypothetical protein
VLAQVKNCLYPGLPGLRQGVIHQPQMVMDVTKEMREIVVMVEAIGEEEVLVLMEAGVEEEEVKESGG